MATNPPADAKASAPRRGRLRRRLAWLALGLVALVLVLVVIAPMIAGPIARPIVQDAVNDQIKGHATIDSLRLSWLGSQRARVRLADPEGGEVADVAVRAERGLLPLAFGSRNLGMVYVSGGADIVRDASGQTNLQRAIEPRHPKPAEPPKPGAEPAELPESLKASLVLDGVDVTYQDAALAEQTGGALGAVRLGSLTGSIDFAVGSPVRIAVQGPLATGESAGALADSGSIDFDATVTNLTDASGTLTPEAADAELALTLAAPAVDAVVHAAFADGTLTRTGETRVTVDADEVAALVPKVAEALRAQPGVQLGELPTLTVAVDSLRFPVGADLRTASAAVRVETTRIDGTIELPSGERAGPAPFAIEPLSLALHAPSLAETVTLKGGTSARIADESAGDLSVDLAVSGLLDESGALRAAMPSQIAGGLRVDGFSTLILQPFLSAINTAMPEGVRLDLPTDLGPTVDATLAAQSRPDAEGAYDVDLSLQSERAQIGAAVAIADNGQRIASREGGVHATFRSLAPLADRFLAPHGIRVSRGAGVEIAATEFAIDLRKLAGPEGPDLRGASAAATVTIADAGGSIQMAGHERALPYTLERFTLGLGMPDAAGEVRVTSEASARVDGAPAGSLRADITAASLLDESGAPRTGALPMLRGEVRLDAVSMATLDKVLAPQLAPSGLVLAQELGERTDVLLLAASNPEAGPNGTDIDLTVRSRNLDITAPLTLTPERIRSREPVMLVGRTAGATLARMTRGKSPVWFEEAGAARIALADIDVPLGPGFTVRPDHARASVTATLTDLGAHLDLAESPAGAAPAASSAPAPGPDRIGVQRLVATVNAAPGQAPTLSLDGQMGHEGQPFTLAANATLNNVFLAEPAAPGDPMSVLNLDGVMPESRLTITGLPATIARVLPAGMVKIGEKPLDLVLLSRETLGRTADIELTTGPGPGNPEAIRAVATITSEGLQSNFDGRLDRARSIVYIPALNARTRITPRVASHLAETLAPDAPVMPALASPATIALGITKAVTLPLTETFAPDLARFDGVIDARATIDAALAAITLPAEDGAEPMTIPPVTIRALSVDVSSPMTVLSEQGGQAGATLSGALLAADGSSIAELAGEAKATLKAGKPAGAMPVSLTVGNIAGTWLDELLKEPALVSGALGERFTLALTADPDRFIRKDPSAPALSMRIESPRLEASSPLALTVGPEAISLADAFNATWTMGPRWANVIVFGAEPGGPAPAFTLTEQTPVRISLQRLAIATAEGAGPLKPGVFNVDVAATLPTLVARLSDGRALRIGDLALKLGRGPTPEQLGFSLGVPRMKVGDQPEITPKQSEISGTIASFADASGNPTPKAAVLNAQGGIAPIPTDVIDALARQNGMLRDALGPTVDFTIDAKNFSMQGGTLHATATAPLARADIRGRVTEGLFVVHPSSVVQVNRITQDFTDRFIKKAIPMIGSLEKTEADDPARVIFNTPISLPLDGNMDRLNGQLTLDIGTARFGTQDIFQKVLKVAQQRTAGEVGNRLPPLKVTMANGLVSYDRYAIPFGEFTIETQGAINLSSRPRQIREGAPTEGNMLGSRRLEVLTFIPSGAFVAEAVPGIANLSLPVVGGLASLPIRTHGPISDPKNDVAVELAGRNAVENLLDPGKLLDDGGRKLLDDLLGGGGGGD